MIETCIALARGLEGFLFKSQINVWIVFSTECFNHCFNSRWITLLNTFNIWICYWELNASVRKPQPSPWATLHYSLAQISIQKKKNTFRMQSLIIKQWKVSLQQKDERFQILISKDFINREWNELFVKTHLLKNAHTVRTKAVRLGDKHLPFPSVVVTLCMSRVHTKGCTTTEF